MAIKMGNMLEMIISCAESPATMKEQMRYLGLRHVTYKVGPLNLTLTLNLNLNLWASDMSSARSVSS